MAGDDLDNSIGEDLEEAWAELSGSDASDSDAVASDTSSESDRARDERGRFAAAQKDDASAELPIDGEETLDDGIDHTADTIPVEAPGWFSDSEKAQFAQLPPPLQQALATGEQQREQYFRGLAQEFQAVRQNLADVEQALAPHMEKLALSNISPGQIIKQFFTAQEVLNRDPATALRDIAASYGLTFQELAQMEAQAPYRQANPEMEDLRQQVEALRQERQQQEQAQIQQRRGSVSKEIETFAKETGPDGKPLRPEFDAIATDPMFEGMVGFFYKQNPAAPIRDHLNQAYDQFMWSNPRYRQRMLDRHNRDRVQRAQRNGNSITGAGGPGGSSERPLDTIEDAIFAAADEIGYKLPRG